MAIHEGAFLTAEEKEELDKLTDPNNKLTLEQKERVDYLLAEAKTRYQEHFYGQEEKLLDEITEIITSATYKELVTDYIEKLQHIAFSIPVEYGDGTKKALNRFFLENFEQFTADHIQKNLRGMVIIPISTAKILLSDTDPELLKKIETEAERLISIKTEEILQQKAKISECLNKGQLPEEILFLNDNLTRSTFENKLSSKPSKVYVKRGKASYYSLASITPKEEKAIDISKAMTRFQWQVYNAVCSLWSAGTYTFTASKIYKIITKNDSAKAHDKILLDIDTAIQTMAGISMTLDSGNSGEIYNFDRYVRTAPLLLIEMTYELTENQHGKSIIPTYTIASNIQPILFEYANKLNQIQRELLTAGRQNVSNSQQQITLKHYLNDRIKAMTRQRKGGKITNTIKYEAIYNLYQLNDKSEKQKKARIRDQAKRILDDMIISGTISAYEIEKNRKGEYVDITIIF